MAKIANQYASSKRRRRRTRIDGLKAARALLAPADSEPTPDPLGPPALPQTGRRGQREIFSKGELLRAQIKRDQEPDSIVGGGDQ